MNNEDSVDVDTTDLADNIFPVDNQSEFNNKDDDILQPNKNEINLLLVSEPGTSRRDTYSVDSRPIVIEENTTPTPRRSILKCSKTTKPNRSRSSCRMVQFARLPKTDSKIKNTKTRFNFTVTEDENNVIDLNQSITNSTQVDVEEYDDDLDGVQPLDISVSSLINSPILDNSINKSSKRGSRGNKVMSLVNSIEKRSNESSKHSIRASDLLSMNGSKHIETSPNDDSQNNANIMQESVSSTRRINLEDIFEAEDTLKTASNIENETLAKEIKESPVKSVEIVSSPKTNSFNITDTKKIPGNVFTEDLSKNDTNDVECKFTFASPLILPKISSSSITVIDGDSAFVDSENDFSSTEIIVNQFDKNSKLDMCEFIADNCTTSTNEFLTKTDDVERPTLVHKLSTTSTHDDNINETRRNESVCCDKTVDEEICTDDIETPNNTTELSEKSKSIEKENTQKQNDDSEFINDDVCTNEVQPSKNDVILVNKSTDLNLDQINKQNYVSKDIDQTLNDETPSIVVQSMSEMFNESIDEHETTHSQHKENLVETYVLMGKDDLQNSLGVKGFEKVNLDKGNKTLCENSVLSAESVNKSLMDAIEVQLDKMHGENDSSSNCNENEINLVDLNNQKTLTSNLDLEVTDTENLTLKINDNLSNSSPNTLTVVGSTEIISEPRFLVKDNLSNNCLTDVDCSNVTELPARTLIGETNSVQDINLNNEVSNITLPPDNLSVKDKSPKPINKKLINLDELITALGANNCKELKKSVRSPINESIGHNRRKFDSTKIIAELCLSSSSDDDENDTTKKNLDHSLDTSIGKPRYESTPWNCSKSSKTPFNSTASIQPNETTRDDSAENEDGLRDKSRSRSVTPFASQKEWSQMMKEFNESVKKASVNINININNASIRKKKLFVTKSKLSQVSAQIPTKDSNIKNNTSEIININSIQRLMKSSSMSNNTSYESGHSRRSLRNNSALIKNVRKSSRSNKLQTSRVDNYSSAKTSKGNKILPRKNNSINNKTTDKRNNETVVANTNRLTKSKTIIPVLTIDSDIDLVSCSKSENDSITSHSLKEETYPYSQIKKVTKKKKNSLQSPSTSVNKNKSNYIIKKQDNVQIKATKDSPSSIDSKRSCSTSSTNEIQTFKRELRRRKLMNPSSIKTRKNTLNTDKVKTTEKSKKKNTSSTKRYSTSTNNALSESGIIKLDKKNKNVVKSKSTKISKTVKTKKSTNLKTNMNSRSKRLLPSKPIKTSTKDSSEYESSSETEENTQKLQSIIHPTKSIKKKTQKKNVDVDINLSVLPTRRSQREKLKMSDVSMQSGMQIRRRAANKSPLTQNSKDKKKDILSKVVTNSVSQASNSPKMPSNVVTKQNSAISILVPDDSLPETTKKFASLRSKKNSQLNCLLSSKPIKTNIKDSLEHELLTETEESTQKSQSIHCPPKSTKEKTKKKDVNVDNNLSSLSTKRNLREKSKTSDVSLQPPKTHSRKRAADTSPLSQPRAKGKKCDISSKVANTVSRASNSPNIRTRNMSKLTIKQVSNSSFPETTIVIKKEKKKSTEKVKAKSNENTQTKKRQLNSDNCSFDSAPSTSKKIRQGTFRGAESENKKSNSSTRTTSKIQNTDDSTEPIASLKVKYNK